jgi:hypothetical protein
MHMLAQRVGGSTVWSHSQPGTRRRRVVNTTLVPRYPLERPGTRCTGGCVRLGAVWTARKNSCSPGFSPRTFRLVESRCTYWAIHGRNVSNIVQNHVIHSSVSSAQAEWYIAYRGLCITLKVTFDRVSSVGAFLCHQVFHQLSVSEENVWA